MCVARYLRNNQTELYAALSRDGGAVWDQEQMRLSVAGWEHVNAAIPLWLLTRTRVYILFRNAVGGARDMYVVSSTDHVLRFPKHGNWAQGTGKMKACPMDGGMLAVDRSGACMQYGDSKEKIFRTTASGSAEEFLGEGEQPWILVKLKGCQLAMDD